MHNNSGPPDFDSGGAGSAGDSADSQDSEGVQVTGYTQVAYRLYVRLLTDYLQHIVQILQQLRHGHD